MIGTCAAAGYMSCCDDGSECLGSPGNCKCDAECRDHGDCCSDIGSTCPLTRKHNCMMILSEVIYSYVIFSPTNIASGNFTIQTSKSIIYNAVDKMLCVFAYHP